MNREDIIKLARECGLPSDELYHPNLERFASIVAAAAIHDDLLWQAETETAVLGEREACAKVCDEQKDRSLAARDKSKRVTDQRVYHSGAQTAAWNAAAIRARKENT